MSKIRCIKCKKEILDGIRFCPFCGAEQKVSSNSSSYNKNPFEILQITPNAEEEVIKAAYKSLAKKYHPDVLKNGTSEERMKELNWAYAELSDPNKLALWRLRSQPSKYTKKSTKTKQASKQTKDDIPDPWNGSYRRKSQTSQEQNQKQKSEPAPKKPPVPETRPESDNDFPKDPPAGKVFWTFILLVITNLSVGVLVYFVSALMYGEDASVTIGGLANLGTRILLGTWAVRDREKQKQLSSLNKILIFILAFIPIGSWFAITYAARYIVRKKQIGTLAGVGAICIGFIALIFFALAPTPSPDSRTITSYQTSTPKPIKSTSTPRPKPKPSITPLPERNISASGNECYHWTDITTRMAGREVCVYGDAYDIYRTGQTSTRIRFTSRPNTFFIYSVNYVFPDLREGDCVMAEEVVQLWENSIPFMALNDLYYCEPWME